MHALRLHCVDKPGIVAIVATALAENQCNIEESAQFNDHLSGHFFMRCVVQPQNEDCLSGFLARFAEIVDTYGMIWDIHDLSQPTKTLIMVSKPDHCLNDLLYRWRTQHLPIDITGVVSNHEDGRTLVEQNDLPFHYVPITPETKPQQESELCRIIDHNGSAAPAGTELIVLARYMQVLSADMCETYAGRIINIHHSFLPGFKGAKPYHQAYERGVKIIGATAHFATPDLDEGPIIAQDVEDVNHTYTPEKMRALGRDIESKVLARSIQLYTQRRIFLHDGRTVIL